MQSFNMFITALVASLVGASPIAEKRDLVERQDAGNGTVIMCTETNWRGECVALTVPLLYDSCTPLPATWQYNISSFEPVYGTVCWLQKSTNCSDECRSPSGCNMIVEFPGYADLSTYGPWNNAVGSITCEASTFVPSKN